MAMLLLVVGSYTVVKAVRDALFLSKFGVTQRSFIAMWKFRAAGDRRARRRRDSSN